MTIEEIGQFFKDNKDNEKVKTFIATLAPAVTADTVKPFLETEDGKRMLQPIMDKRVTEALKTYKEGHFAEEVKAATDAEVLKRNPKETEEQKRLREIEGELAQTKAQAKKAELHRQGADVFSKLGIPLFHLDHFTGSTIEELTTYAEQVQKSYGDREAKVRNELLGSGYKPGSGNGGASGGAGKPDVSKMSAKERFEFFKAEAEKREQPVAAAKP